MTKNYGEAYAARARSKLNQDAALAELCAAQKALHESEERHRRAVDSYLKATQEYQRCVAEESELGKVIDRTEEEELSVQGDQTSKSQHLKDLLRENPRLTSREAAVAMEGYADPQSVGRASSLRHYLKRSGQLRKNADGSWTVV